MLFSNDGERGHDLQAIRLPDYTSNGSRRPAAKRPS
jgi:hypothetical protein